MGECGRLRVFDTFSREAMALKLEAELSNPKRSSKSMHLITGIGLLVGGSLLVAGLAVLARYMTT